MTDFKVIYVVYMDSNIIVGTSTVEEQAYALVRTEARIHRESEFMIRMTETVFDSITNPRDKLSLRHDQKSKNDQCLYMHRYIPETGKWDGRTLASGCQELPF